MVSREQGKIHLRVAMAGAAMLGNAFGFASLGFQGLSADQSWGVDGLASTI